MNQATITNVIYAILIIIAVLGEQLHFLPAGFANGILLVVTGHAVGGTTLAIPNNKTTNTVTPAAQSDPFTDETQG